MRAVIWLVLLFGVAVIAATTLGHNDGLVSVYWRGWRFDLSLNLFIVGFVLSCFVLVSSIKAVSALIGLPARAREWRVTRREQATQAAMRESLSEFFGGRYGRAAKAAQRVPSIQGSTPELVRDRELRVLSHLLGAVSKHRLQDRTGRDAQMREVQQMLDKPGVPRVAAEGAQLLAAEWALEDRDGARALALLANFPAGLARRTQALRLKMQAQRLEGRSLEALRTARMLAKHQGFSAVAARGLLRSLAFAAIDGAHDADQLRSVWQQLDHANRRDPPVCARAARRGAALGALDDARAWLRPLWEKLDDLGAEGREDVALALVQCVAGIGVEWLPRLEEALRLFAHEPAIALAVGSAFAERQLRGKARRPLEQAAEASALPASARRHALRLLASLARDEGDEARAAAHEHVAAQLD